MDSEFKHHEIFDQFDSILPYPQPDIIQDFIGGKYRREFLDLPYLKGMSAEDLTEMQSIRPSYDEEYFEWIDVLQSVLNAKEQYKMVELGAGFGRWTIRAILAARMKNIANVQTISVEAEPIHAKWMKEAFEDNGITGDHHRIVEAAVSCYHGTIPFLVKPPEDWEESGPADWYGQSISMMDYSRDGDNEFYHGHPIKYYGNNWGGIDVPVLPLADILKNDGIIDLIDMDIQGEEAKLVEGSLDYLNENVKMLHIGTHSRDIDGRLIIALSTAGWVNKRIYLSHALQETPYGEISFQDGVQTWINPRLCPEAK